MEGKESGWSWKRVKWGVVNGDEKVIMIKKILRLQFCIPYFSNATSKTCFIYINPKVYILFLCILCKLKTIHLKSRA